MRGRPCRRERRQISKFALLLLLQACASSGDRTEACDGWANDGECEKNPAFMWEKCRMACHSLGLREPFADFDEVAQKRISRGEEQILQIEFPRGIDSRAMAPLRIVLRPDLSPRTVAAIIRSIGDSKGGAAIIYRNEARPEKPPGMCGSIQCGPNALIQGRKEALTGMPAEGVPIVRRGFVARIHNSNDFFIALDDHEEWGHSFTVFGDMRDDVFGLESLEKIATMPFREQKAAGSETVMRLLNEEIEVNARIIGGGRSSVPASFEL